MFQETTLIGNVGNEPEMRYLPDGTAVTNFSLAVNKNWKDNGVDRQATTWFRISTWGKTAEVVNQYVQRGALVMVKGELTSDPKTGSPRTFVRTDGTVGCSFELRANMIKFLSKKSEANEETDVPY